jgi:hypothetical protein
MSNEFPKSSHNLDQAVSGLVRYEDILQACHNEFEKRGLMPSETPGAPPAPPAPVDTGWGFERIFYIVNSRFEIHSDSEAGLDDQEGRIRAAFGQQQPKSMW